VGLDDSGSVTFSERQGLLLTLRGAVAALPRPNHVRIVRYGRTARTVWDGSVRGLRDLRDIERRYLADAPRPGEAIRNRGTYLTPFLKLVEKAAPVADAQFALAVLTDGGCDDLNTATPVVARLAAHPGLRVVWIAGVETAPGLQQWDALEHLFAPCRRRLFITGAGNSTVPAAIRALIRTETR